MKLKLSKADKEALENALRKMAEVARLTVDAAWRTAKVTDPRIRHAPARLRR